MSNSNDRVPINTAFKVSEFSPERLDSFAIELVECGDAQRVMDAIIRQMGAQVNT